MKVMSLKYFIEDNKKGYIQELKTRLLICYIQNNTITEITLKKLKNSYKLLRIKSTNQDTTK